MSRDFEAECGPGLPMVLEYYRWLGDALSEEALRRKVERLSAEITDNPVDAHFLLHRAIAYGHLDEVDEAMRDYDRVIKLCPDDPKVHYTRGAMLLDQGQLKAAIPDFDRATELDPSHTDAYYRRGIARMHLGQYRRAVQDFDHVISLNPRHEFVHYDRRVAADRATGGDQGLTWPA